MGHFHELSDEAMPADALLEAREVTREFTARGERTVALGGVTFQVRPGEFVSMVGPSGCGKSTLVRLLAGLLKSTSGEILVDGRRVQGPPPGLVVLFQQYEKSLLPWRDVWSNVRFGLQNQRLSRTESNRRIEQALAGVDLLDFAHHHPHQLSGGMQQRVAIARALARQPRVLLMDEPFSSLDALTRGDLQDLILRLWEEQGQTIVFVTHDVDEAVYLSSRVLVLSARPAIIRDDVEVPLTYPRSQTLTREASGFLKARRHVYGLIRDEVGEHHADRSNPVPA